MSKHTVSTKFGSTRTTEFQTIADKEPRRSKPSTCRDVGGLNVEVPDDDTQVALLLVLGQCGRDGSGSQLNTSQDLNTTHLRRMLTTSFDLVLQAGSNGTAPFLSSPGTAFDESDSEDSPSYHWPGNRGSTSRIHAKTRMSHSHSKDSARESRDSTSSRDICRDKVAICCDAYIERILHFHLLLFHVVQLASASFRGESVGRMLCTEPQNVRCIAVLSVFSCRSKKARMPSFNIGPGPSFSLNAPK